MGRESPKIRTTDWDELMRAMLLPTPTPSRCRMTAAKVITRSKKSKKKKKSRPNRCEPKFEFLLCTVFKNVFGSCSKDSQGSSIKLIAKKLHKLESKVNDIEKNCCTGPRRRARSPILSPKQSPVTSPSRTPPRSPQRTPPSTPPPAPPPEPVVKSTATQDNMQPELSRDSVDYEIKGLKVRQDEGRADKEYLKTLKAVDVKPDDERRRSIKAYVRHRTKGQKKDWENSISRNSEDLYRRRTGGSGAESLKENAEEPQRRITQYFHEEKCAQNPSKESNEFLFQLISPLGNCLFTSSLSGPACNVKTPEIEPSSSTSISTYIVENQTKSIYVAHGTGQAKLVKRFPKCGSNFKGYKHDNKNELYARESSGTCIYDWPSADDSQDSLYKYKNDCRECFKNDSVFNRVVKNEKTRPVCFASPISTSSESLPFEPVCVVKSKSVPLRGRRLRQKIN